MSINSWLSINSQIRDKKLFNFFYLASFLFFLAITMLLFIFTQKNQWLKLTSLVAFVFLQLIDKFKKLFSGKSLNSLNRHNLLKILRWLNILLLITVVPKLLIVSNLKYGLSFEGITLLISAIFLSVIIYRHWRQFGLIVKRSGEFIWPIFYFGFFSFIILLTLFFASPENKSFIFAPLFIMLYGAFPEILKFITNLYKKPNNLFWLFFWIFVSVAFYISELFLSRILGASYSLFILSFIASIIVWREFLNFLRVRLDVDLHWPYFGYLVYGREGVKYFIGSIFVTIGVSLASIFKFDFVGSQLSIITYLMLLFGILFEILALLKDNSSIDQEGFIER